MHFCHTNTAFWALSLLIFMSASIVRAQSLGKQRQDENSRIAHHQLLEKAKKGRIDVYFVGDSITRR